MTVESLLCMGFRVNWEVFFVRSTLGFGVAYPKRAPKLLVGQSQTILMCLGNTNTLPNSRHSYNFVFPFLILRFVSCHIFCICVCGFICSTCPKFILIFSKKQYHFFTILLILFHNSTIIHKQKPNVIPNIRPPKNRTNLFPKPEQTPIDFTVNHDIRQERASTPVVARPRPLLRAF